MELAMESIKPIIEKIEENLLERIGQQIGYLIHLNSNVKNLKDQFQKLGDKRLGMQLEIDEAERNGEVMAPEVERWVQKVDNISEGLQGFLEEDVKANTMCLDGWCPNLKLRYSLSRKAKKKTLEIDGLLKDGQFARLSYRPPPQGIGSSGFKVFESRISIVKEVLKALRDNNINMIAICGMGGIGKTTMAKEVAKIAKDDKLFDEVAMAVVSQNQDDKKIQGQIAEMLDLKLEEHSPLVRAERLKNRLTSGKSVLVILDDIWDTLNLDDVGIPYGGQHNICKILLTSRSEDTCNQMKSQKIFKIEVLSGEESWNLFREMAGNCVDTLNLRPIAKEVAGECGGLPVALVIVGRALENKSEPEWSAALQQLKKSIPKNILGLDSKVYSSIKLSYDYLKSDEAESCFLLCCLFPEDYDIHIEYLVRYGVGQSLLAKIDNVGEARNRVHAIVKNLKRSFLLLDSKETESVKMHDVVRDVAISIAENRGFLVQCNNEMEEWPEKETYEHSAISLASEKLRRHPDGMVCPKLELLQLLCFWGTVQTLPANLFKGMSGLKVLSLRGMSFPSLPESIHVLQNLRALHLDFCEFTDVSAIGALRKLEILSFLRSNIEELPREMENLSHLKVLDLSECLFLRQIPPGLLSSLSHLEELYMSGVCVYWEPMEGNKEGANASLAELMSLSNHLMALTIYIPNIKVLPKDILFKNQMTKFQISVGEFMDDYLDKGSYLFKNKLVLRKCDIAEGRPLFQLSAKCEDLSLVEIKDLKNIAYELDKEGFQCLKVLDVRYSINVEYVIDATLHQTPRAAFPILESLNLDSLYNLKEIYHCQFPERSLPDAKLGCFGNLRSIYLYDCKQLNNIFSLSIARSLVQLQELQITDCHMKEIFPKEGEDEKALDKIMFPQLTRITLWWLPSLIGFCTGVGPIQLVQSSLNQEVGSSETDKLTTSEKAEVTDIQQHTTRSDFLESTPLIAHKLFSSTTILWSPNLEELWLRSNDSLEVVFDLGGLEVNNIDRQGITILTQLKTLEVDGLSKLAYMWKNVPRGIQGFQNLTLITVTSCNHLIYLIPLSVAKQLVKLESIILSDCDAIKNIVQRDGEEEAADIIMFPKVSSLFLGSLPNLVSFCIEACSFEWPSIKEITLRHCYNLKTIGSETQSPRKLKKINEELDSRPHEPRIGSLGFLGRCLECVPRGKNYGPMAVSDQGTTNKSQRSYSVKKEGTLTKLKDPRASDINNPSKIWSLFPSNLIEYLKNLEAVALERCDSIEVIFQLEELNVEESHVAPVLDQLRELHLDHLPKLMHIWKKGPKRIVGFGNLKLLKVEKCNNLTNLFSPSIGKLLVMLEEIKVIGCEKIEELLAIAKEEDEKVLFDKVKSIRLEDLPNLQCFCKKENAFEWSSLEKIVVIGCPNLRTFVPTNLKTPKLEGVYEDKEFETPQWKGDLNATLEHIFKGKEKQVDHDIQQQEQTGTLTKPKDPRATDINKSSKIWSLFPSNLIECLKNLESVNLQNCDSIEVIFQLEELNVEESHVAPVLDQLRELHLKGLPKLMHIWKNGPKGIMGFGNLRLLKVENCNNLTNLFSPSIGKLFVMLEEIKVIGCEKIEELLAIAKEEDEKVLFDKVESIRLEDLPNLQCFCKKENASEWSSLKEIMVIGCPNLRTFVPTNLKTPKLEGVYEDKGFGTLQWKGDLNATLEHIFKGKEEQVDHDIQQQEQTEEQWIMRHSNKRN